MVWPRRKSLWHGEDNSARDSERSKKERKTEEGYSPQKSPRIFRGDYSLYIRAKLTSAVNHRDSYIGFCCVY